MPRVETVTYTATDATDSIALTDDATVDFTFSDATPPTNTITLDTANRALLTGTTLYYNGAAGGSFTLSSAVADGGAGPFSAVYPGVAQAGWAHGAETVSTPAGGPYASSSFTFGAGTSGDFTYDVTANDAWTPTNSSLTTLNVTEDSTAPAASILCNAAACAGGWYTASPVTVTLTAPDTGAGLDQIRYTTDGTDPTIFTGNVYAGAFTVAAEGVTTVKYRAFDRIGNDSGVLAQTVRIDTIAPDTTLDSTPAAATQDTTPTFAFSSPEPGTTFQVRLNGGSWTPATSPLTLGPLAENTYTLDVRATDVAGNVDASPASFIFTVDTTSANTTITSSPPADSNSTSASFSFIASDAGPGFECRLDGGAFANCSSPVSYTGLTEAAHTFEVRAKDAAGNLDATPATHAWTVDLTAPNTSFLSTPADPSPDSTPDVRPRLDRVPRDLRVRPRRRRLGALRDAVHDAGARRRLPHAEGPRERRRREHGRDRGHVHVARRRHRPDRLDHRPRRTAPTSAARSCSSATRPTAAPASRASSSSAPRPARASGRTRLRAGTRPPRPTATTTSARSRPTPPATPSRRR